jgi:O-antigen/teichoic acid export membrane protein
MIIVVRILPREENGIFQYFLGIFPIFLAFAEFGINTALIYFLSSFRQLHHKVSTIIKSSLYLKVVAFLILCLVAFVYSFWNGNAFAIFLVLLGAEIVSVHTYFEAILISFQSYLKLSIWNPLPNFIRLILLVSVFYSNLLPLNSITILTIYTVSPLVTLLIFFFMSDPSKLSWSQVFSEKEYIIKDIFKFQAWSFVASLFAIFADRIEILYLKEFQNPEQIADYGSTLQILNGFSILFSTIQSVTYPKLNSAKSIEELKIQIKSVLKICFTIILLLLPGWYIGADILVWIFGPKYEACRNLFYVLYPNFLLQLIFAPMGLLLFSLKKPKQLGFLSFLRVISGLIFGYILIPNYGAVGASYSFLLGQLPSWILLIVFVFYYLNQKE